MKNTTNLTSANDKVFKAVAYSVHGKVILEAILSSILDTKIIIEKFLNVELPKIKYREKGKNLDLLLKTNIGYINVEVNNKDYTKTKIARNFTYMCEFLAQNISKGEDYNLDKMYIQVNLNFGKIKTSFIVTNGKLINEEQILVENFKIMGCSIEKLREICYIDDKLREKYKYILMLSLDEEELQDFYPEDEIIRKYGGIIMQLNSDADFVRSITPEKERQMILNSEKKESFKEGEAKGLVEGEINGITKVAKALLATNQSAEYISRVTGLSKNVIETFM